MKFASLLPAAAAFAFSSVHAATVEFNWTVSWVTANPSHQYPREVIGINGEWPLPRVEVNKGDRVIVNLHNGLGNQNTSIHFHGMYQNGTNYMDGPALITQCPVPPGGNFTYDFMADQNGTYWYHSHVYGQYPDGQRAPFIIHDPEAFYNDMYDEELTFTVSDWYDNTVDVLDKEFLNIYNPTGAEPIPDYLVFNDDFNVSISVKPNTTYLLHLLNIGALGSVYFWLEDHNITIVEVDGIYVEPQETDILYITVAQRYTVLFTTKDTTERNYAIVSVFDSGLFDIPEDVKTPNTTNWLEYNASAPHDIYKVPYETSDDITPFDDFGLVPYDHLELYPEPDVEFVLNVSMTNLLNGVNYAFFNNITYTAPEVPTLYTVMSAPEDLVDNPTIYGQYTHPLVIEHMQVVQVVINSIDPGTHPFHLHGHAFQVIHRSEASDEDPIPFDASEVSDYPTYPLRRDVAQVKPLGNMVLRFVADNPGVWFFHCHIEWHLNQGLAVVFVEAPSQLRNQTIPQSHYNTCSAAGLPYKGNAAANTQDFLNLAGQNSQQPDLPAGFTARGVVALVFSCICAFLGMGVITWYGLSDTSASDAKVIQILEERDIIEEHEQEQEQVHESYVHETESGFRN